MNHIVESTLDYTVDAQTYSGLLLKVPGTIPRAAVVLLPDWRGQSQLARDHAGFMVSLGCTVAIADLYGGGFRPTSPEQVGPLVKRLMENRPQGVAGLAACVDRLKKEIPTGTPIMCLGYSAGGMVALDYGRSGADVAGIILCTALLKTAAPGMGARIRPPVLVLQGTQDQVSPVETIAAVISEMDQAGNDVRFALFTQTHHAFDNPEAGSDPNARLVYSANSARLAREAIENFLIEVTGRTPGQ